TVFVQDSIPVCSKNHPIPGVCGVSTGKAVVWYSFYGLKNGKLGFEVSPENSSDDYNWMLFDITGHPYTDIYRNSGLIRGGNWSEKEGETGASADGEGTLICTSPTEEPPYPSSFSTMPHIVKNHLYLLMISHHNGAVKDG